MWQRMRSKYEPVDLLPPGPDKDCGKDIGVSVIALKPDSRSARRVGVLLLLPQLIALIGITVVAVIARQRRGVTLVYGDSLVVGSPRRFTPLSLVDRMRIDSSFSRIIYANGMGGATIDSLVMYLDFVLKYYRPQYVIMLWDTDAMIRYTEYSPEAFGKYLNDYIQLLRYACSGILDTGAKLAISGPVLLRDEQLYNTSFVLDLFREINRNISMELNITYIDLRKAFSENGGSALTLDGEHFNFYGIGLTSKLFLRLLDEWESTA